jgi:hypothetical protein
MKYIPFLLIQIYFNHCVTDDELKAHRNRNYYTQKTYCVSCSSGEVNEIKKNYKDFKNGSSETGKIPANMGGTEQERMLKKSGSQNNQGISIPFEFK